MGRTVMAVVDTDNRVEVAETARMLADCERMILEADLAERSEEVRLMSERIEQLEDALVRLAVQCSEAQTRFVALKEAYDTIAWRQA